MITAEVGDYSDSEMAQFALAENTERNDLSDYERAIAFRRLNVEFGLTYEQIGELVGCSKAHISNHLRMLDLFDIKALAANPSLVALMSKISERHARVLVHIENSDDRAAALRLAVNEGLSVRELEKVVSKFRSWFAKDHSVYLELPPLRPGGPERDERHADLLEIFDVLALDFESPHTKDFDSFLRIHSFASGFSIYSNFPPRRRLRNKEALKKEKEWFYSVAPSYKSHLRDIDVKFYDQVAVATLYVDYSKLDERRIIMSSGGTVVLVKKSGKWTIVHEHWSSNGIKSSPGQTAFEDA
jgi:hypothetical protein